jgi:hypothetical protein
MWKICENFQRTRSNVILSTVGGGTRWLIIMQSVNDKQAGAEAIYISRYMNNQNWKVLARVLYGWCCNAPDGVYIFHACLFLAAREQMLTFLYLDSLRRHLMCPVSLTHLQLLLQHLQVHPRTVYPI